MKVVEDKNENYSQDNLPLERTKSNTPKFTDHKNSDVCEHAERILQDVDLRFNSIRESRLAGREFTMTRSTYKESKKSQA